MKIVDKRPIMKAVRFSEICPGNVFERKGYYLKLLDIDGQPWGVDLENGHLTDFRDSDLVYPVVAEVSIIS